MEHSQCYLDWDRSFQWADRSRQNRTSLSLALLLSNCTSQIEDILLDLARKEGSVGILTRDHFQCNGSLVDLSEPQLSATSYCWSCCRSSPGLRSLQACRLWGLPADLQLTWLCSHTNREFLECCQLTYTMPLYLTNQRLCHLTRSILYSGCTILDLLHRDYMDVRVVHYNRIESELRQHATCCSASM